MSEKNKVYIEDFDDGSGGWEEYPNPLLIEGSSAQKEVLKQGFNLAKEGQIVEF